MNNYTCPYIDEYRCCRQMCRLRFPLLNVTRFVMRPWYCSGYNVSHPTTTSC